MIEQNLPAHYLTQNKDIYNKYCYMKENCLTIIPVKNKKEIIDGNFLEKYLSLILRLKATISGAEFFSINNLFFNIEYITHISLGHGISYLKHFLYNCSSYYGKNRYNKILIPFSKKLLSVANKYGWNDDDIIKINLPRWDKYNDSKKIFQIKNYSKSIFIMFTWRDLVKNGSISSDYYKNILNLLQNNLLIKEIQKNNVTLYFAFHHRLLHRFKTKILNTNYIKFINENQISDILSKTDLVITDFSSIIFDIIYRQKPFIMYIPDSNYAYNKNNYVENYYKLIEDLKAGKIHFENIYFNINKVVKKIIYYIKNSFELEKNLKNFYKSFGFKKENSILQFIDYLKKLK
jgi:CDP-glycerol glycerophosphotransferase (TagB/SpsB family)